MTSFIGSDICSTRIMKHLFSKKNVVFERKICETAMGTNWPTTCSEKGKCGSNVGFRTPVGVAFTDKWLFTFLCQLKRYDPVYLVNCENSVPGFFPS